MNADIMEAHDVIDHIERELKEKFGIETSAHMDPIATEDEGVNRTRLWVAQQVKELDERLTIHDFRMTAGPHHTNLIFDVVAPHNFPMEDEALAAAIQQRIQAHDPHCYAVIQVDHAYVE